MLQLRSELDFSLKPLGANARGEYGCKDFYDDLAAECDFFADEDATHAPPPSSRSMS